jgi:hypothetical protein
MGNTGGIDVELVEEFLARALRDKLSLNMLPSDRCLDAFSARILYKRAWQASFKHSSSSRAL